jgi:hypothetical protein
MEKNWPGSTCQQLHIVHTNRDNIQHFVYSSALINMYLSNTSCCHNPQFRVISVESIYLNIVTISNPRAKENSKKDNISTWHNISINQIVCLP